MSEIKDHEIKTPETTVDTGKETGGEASQGTKDAVIDQAKEQVGIF